jgi:DNA-directed RNA polymerase specialized sigma24 family protein
VDVARKEVRVSDFDEYVAARGPALLALAVLVAGEEAEARRHVATVLARALPRWDTLVHREDPDAALRRDLVADLGRPRLRRARPAPDPDWHPAPPQEATWRAWLALPRTTRALLALRYAEQRSWIELSWMTDLPVRAARQRVERALERLGPEDLVTETLLGRVESLDTWPVELSRQAEWASRSRRERHVRGAVAAGIAVVVAVPVVLALVPGALGGLGDLDMSPVPDTTVPDSVLPAGWRAESWRGVEVGVPEDWGYVSLSTWCSARDEGSTPRVERPGRYPALDCRPPLGPGVQFRTVGDPAPEVASDLVVDEVRLGSVVVLVATDDEELTEKVLSTARLVERLDAAGCEVQRSVPRAGRTFPPADPGATALSVCRYGVGFSGPNLVQSERLSVLDSAEALQALDEAPTLTSRQACFDGPGEEAVLFASAQGDVAWLHLGRCQSMDDDGTHLLTEDVLYWALSPGWNGDRRDLPMPERLRGAPQA